MFIKSSFEEGGTSQRRKRDDHAGSWSRAVASYRVVSALLERRGAVARAAIVSVVCEHTVRVTRRALGVRAGSNQAVRPVFRSRAELQIEHADPAAPCISNLPAEKHVVVCRRVR